jgi:hypothetical protein
MSLIQIKGIPKKYEWQCEVCTTLCTYYALVASDDFTLTHVSNLCLNHMMSSLLLFLFAHTFLISNHFNNLTSQSFVIAMIGMKENCHLLN